MTKARDLANAGTALTSVSATELGYVDGVTSAIQTQLDGKEPTLPSQTGNSGKYLTTNGSTKSWGTVSQYSLPSQTGNSGKFLTTNGTSEFWGSVGYNWTQRQSQSSNNEVLSIAYNGSNLYVGAGNSGVLYTSPDGITWTSRTSGFGSNAINKVAYGNGLFVAVGDNGTLTTSSDGITWTARTSNMSTNAIRDVLYANSVWVAVGFGGGATNTGGLIYSTDGITWTRKSQSLTVGTQYYTVMWNGTNWLIGTDYSTNNFLYASTPSGTWTAAKIDGNNAIYKFIYDGTRTIFSNSSNNFYWSTSTTLATSTSINGLSPTLGSLANARIFYYNGRMYIISGGYLHSISTTPSSHGNGFSDMQPPILLPGGYVTDGSPQVQSGIYTCHVNATGIILGGNYFDFWTSF